MSDLFKGFAATLFSTIRFYKERTGWSVFDIYDTYRKDIIETVANEADISVDDIEIRVFVAGIDKFFYKE